MAHDPELSTHTVTGRYRRRPAPWLWLALLLIPLLAALLSWFLNRDDAPSSAAAPPSATSSATGTSAPVGPADAAPVSVVGDTTHRLFVTAVVPDGQSRTALLDAVRSAAGTHPVVNRVTVSKGQPVTDHAGLSALVKDASARLDEFGIMLTPTAVTVRGTSAATDAGAAVEQTARGAFPGRDVRVDLSGGGATPSGAPTTQAASTPLTCSDIQTQIAARLSSSPVVFDPSSTAVDATSAQRLTEIGQALAKCNATGVEVQGHTDASGSAAVNGPLSQKRAESVRQVLVDAGLRGDAVTAKGFGATQPVASGAAPDALAKNRRVVILVGNGGN